MEINGLDKHFSLVKDVSPGTVFWYNNGAFLATMNPEAPIWDFISDLFAGFFSPEDCVRECPSATIELAGSPKETYIHLASPGDVVVVGGTTCVVATLPQNTAHMIHADVVVGGRTCIVATPAKREVIPFGSFCGGKIWVLDPKETILHYPDSRLSL